MTGAVSGAGTCERPRLAPPPPPHVHIALTPRHLRPVEVLQERLRVLPRGAQLVAKAGDGRAAVTLADRHYPCLQLRQRLGVEVEVPADADGGSRPLESREQP